MLDAMKQLKIMPCGRCSPFGLSAGVHCTNVAVQHSQSTCLQSYHGLHLLEMHTSGILLGWL
jgi:hypothetical protein